MRKTPSENKNLPQCRGHHGASHQPHARHHSCFWAVPHSPLGLQPQDTVLHAHFLDGNTKALGNNN